MFATPIPRQPPAEAIRLAQSTLEMRQSQFQDATYAIIEINNNFMRAGVDAGASRRGMASARWQQASERLACAREQLTRLQRARALSLFTELHSVMKRKQLRATAVAKLRARQ